MNGDSEIEDLRQKINYVFIGPNSRFLHFGYPFTVEYFFPEIILNPGFIVIDEEL